MRFGAGVVGVVGPVALALLWVVPLHDLYVNLVRIPIVVYPQVRALPFPSLVDAVGEFVRHRSFNALGPSVVYLPLAATAVAIASETLRGRAASSDTAPPASALTLQLLLLLNVLFFAKGLVRVSPLHMGASLVVSVILSRRPRRALATRCGAGAPRQSARWPAPDSWRSPSSAPANEALAGAIGKRGVAVRSLDQPGAGAVPRRPRCRGCAACGSTPTGRRSPATC